MDVYKLGMSSYMPIEMVEGYSSMIWTERFQEPGEFKLVTSKIEQTMALLPEMSLISVKGSDEVMMVESHSITTNGTKGPELTVSGRTVEAFLEHRHVEAEYGKKRKMIKNYSPRGAAGLLIWNAIDNPSEFDVTRDGSYPVPGRDRIPNVMVTDSVGTDGTSKRWWLTEGPLYPQLFDILVRNDIGLRTIRPISTSGTRVKVLTGAANRGDIERETVSDISALRFHLFTGVDRSAGSVNDRVVFNTKHGDVLNPSYLFSVKDFKTSCEVMSSVGGADAHRNNTEKNYTGWDRRVMSWDAGEPEIPDDASASEKQKIKDEFKEDAERDALRALKRTRKVRLFTGDISPESPYQYKTHYDLGDTVALHGEYGQIEKMIVSEYVRTEDGEGDRGYPGLTEP